MQSGESAGIRRVFKSCYSSLCRCHFKEHLGDIVAAKRAKAAGQYDRSLIRSRVNERQRGCQAGDPPASSSNVIKTPDNRDGVLGPEVVRPEGKPAQVPSNIAAGRSRRSYAKVRKPNQVRFLSGMIDGVWVVVNLSKAGVYRHDNAQIARALRALADAVDRTDLCLADKDTDLDLPQ